MRANRVCRSQFMGKFMVMPERIYHWKTFKKEDYFLPIHIDFIRHKEYPALPYPFNMITIYKELKDLEKNFERG